jgi:hypothetical protein
MGDGGGKGRTAEALDPGFLVGHFGVVGWMGLK